MDTNLLPVDAGYSLSSRLSQGTGKEFPATVSSLFALQVAQHPEAPAVSCAGGSVSYDELDSRSNAVAQRLRAAGLVSNDLVGLFLESSVDLVVAALGVWKAGGAYLPIDPAYPADRAAYILSDSGAPILITRRGVESSLGSGQWTTFNIEDIPLEDSDNFTSLPPVTTDNLAYIIYTSGSTGQPKGVEITHGNLINLVEWHIREFSVTRNDRATQ